MICTPISSWYFCSALFDSQLLWKYSDKCLNFLAFDLMKNFAFALRREILFITGISWLNLLWLWVVEYQKEDACFDATNTGSEKWPNKTSFILFFKKITNSFFRSGLWISFQKTENSFRLVTTTDFSLL